MLYDFFRTKVHTLPQDKVSPQHPLSCSLHACTPFLPTSNFQSSSSSTSSVSFSVWLIVVFLATFHSPHSSVDCCFPCRVLLYISTGSVSSLVGLIVVFLAKCEKWQGKLQSTPETLLSLLLVISDQSGKEFNNQPRVIVLITSDFRGRRGAKSSYCLDY